jgi:hypothetical protein
VTRVSIATLLLTAACAGGSAGAPAAPASFPAEPPESVSTAFMDSVFAPSNLVTDGRGATRVPKNIVVVAFRPGTTREERAAAIHAIDGVVVGGHRLSPDRYYYVRVPATGSAGSLGAYLESLSWDPRVESATPLVVVRGQ